MLSQRHRLVRNDTTHLVLQLFQFHLKLEPQSGKPSYASYRPPTHCERPRFTPFMCNECDFKIIQT